MAKELLAMQGVDVWGMVMMVPTMMMVMMVPTKGGKERAQRWEV